VNSMSDLFHPDVPEDFIADVFAVMHQTPRHQFQVLTKRPQRMAQLLGTPDFLEVVQQSIDSMWDDPDEQLIREPWPPRNVWLGTSVEDRRYADLRIPHLLATPAAVRFLSIEPLLGPVDLSEWLCTCKGRRWVDDECWTPDFPHNARTIGNGLIPCGFCNLGGWDVDEWEGPRIDWVIVGGESGPGARPMHPDWVRSIRDQCQAAGAPFFFKQWGEWSTSEQCGVHNGQLSSRRFEFESRRFAADGTPYEPRSDRGPADPRGPGGFAMPGMESLIRVGKKRAGRELDGRTWDEMPEPALRATG